LTSGLDEGRTAVGELPWGNRDRDREVYSEAEKVQRVEREKQRGRAKQV